MNRHPKISNCLTFNFPCDKISFARGRGVVVQHAALSRPRSRVQIPSLPLKVRVYLLALFPFNTSFIPAHCSYRSINPSTLQCGLIAFRSTKTSLIQVDHSRAFRHEVAQLFRVFRVSKIKQTEQGSANHPGKGHCPDQRLG